ncbi:hypothetical protein EK0264_15650 [Epidermidibacterium keratini]|uniref:Uncharacterized protein n=1 Tax=Epidermidibacterium keratini TaxID=1891644 RepID=A0A7L4YRP8_9ACTN|nr:hypothetical protein [Epidermidibacterium keratini]QHC01584.1 hypothetical protein EK0264_15650 [Epidermidibacterium keratini]
MDSELALTRTGLVTRLGLSAIAFVLLLGGTFFGSDADFPFGPFKMYSNRNDPNGTVRSLRLEGVNVEGELFAISAGDVGLRRAELEGSLPQMKSDPKLMEVIADRYAANNPDAPELTELHVVVRIKTLKDGKETGEFVDKIEAKWTKP